MKSYEFVVLLILAILVVMLASVGDSNRHGPPPLHHSPGDFYHSDN